MISTTRTCPSCKQPIGLGYTVHPQSKELTISLWCQTGGRCPSDAANEGADGKTEEEAYQRLCAKIDQETEETMEPI